MGAASRSAHSDFTHVSYGITHPGCVRARNEDAFLNAGQHGIWAVADGMGGHSGGDIASTRVIASLRALHVDQALSSAKARAATALQGAHDDLWAQGQVQTGGVIGSTVALLLARGGFFACIWAGDSRVYRLRSGELQQLTHDHRHVQALIDAGLLSPEQAQAHPRAHVLTRAIGATASLQLDVVEGELERGDRFLLCSDGLSNLVSSSQIAGALQRSPPQAATEWLLKRAIASGAPDNVTAITVAVA